MALTRGSRVGVYDITAPIGEGGMGQVYRATDTRLKRQVAIKILPPSFAADHDRIARFQREAEVLASLNHPNIAAIYGLEDSEGVAALVMELVDGDDLSQRIARGPIPVDEALPIARQIAEALEAAHEQGIVHRDLKPANIKVRADGTVKVLDFGLAKAMDPAVTSSGNLSMSPTLTTPAMTQAGMILGTAAYMSPEQARGRAVDKRTDIWAFGAVLYEMLSGSRAFAGDDVSETLASIIKDTPAFERLPAEVPPAIRRLLQRCLERDVRQRLRDIGEARVALATVESAGPEPVTATTATGPARRWSLNVIAWGVAAVALIAAFVMYRQSVDAQPTGARIVRLPFVPSANVMSADLGAAIISPDGQTLVFSGRAASDGRRMLWARALDSLESRPLPDTEDAIEPFWSPDSRSIGFGAQGKLKRIDLAGGRAQTISDAARLNGGAWSPSGMIVFSPDYRMPLYRVQASGGGERVAVTPSNQEARYPVFLPDGRHFLYYVPGEGTASTFIGSVDSADVKRLLPDAGPTVYARPGSLLYDRNGMLVAHPFNADRLELIGEPVPVAAAPAKANITGGGRISVSDTGVLVLQASPTFDYQLTWFDRAGTRLGTLGPVLEVSAAQQPRLSPDGKRVVIQRIDPQRKQAGLWIGDVAHDTFDRFTTQFAQLAIWSPDSRSVITATTLNGVAGIYRMPAAGGDAQLMLTGTVFPRDESSDGRWLFYAQRGEKSRMDIWALPLGDAGPPDKNREPHPVLNSEFDEEEAQVSPDGRWLAYTSDVTGRYEIYTRPLGADGVPGETTRVSTTGGVNPRWGRDGRELFYVDLSKGASAAQMMTVPVKASSSNFEFGAAVPLFKVSMAPNAATSRDYDVSVDNQRFLIGTVLNRTNTTPITIVLDWWAGLKK